MDSGNDACVALAGLYRGRAAAVCMMMNSYV
ncbi:hypothetical protein KCP77_11390 [Salmonella enterica subsp. enterica]|nr:hypothetical protein KCP77_11390 [Salmonella enterica subsp. enterica]